MRITEHRMIQLSSQNLARGRERIAEAGEQLSTGERVARPSQDPAAWAAGRRAEVARTLNAGRAEALARSQERLDLADGALAAIGNSLQRARELAVMATSETMSVDELTAIGAELDGLRQSMMAAANTRTSDGEYIFAGSRADQPAFDANGVYQGDGLALQLETQSGLEQPVTITGEVLTAAGGVDIFAEIDGFRAALAAGDRTAMGAAVDTLAAANQQVSAARADGGARFASLAAADEVQRDLDLSLAALQDRLVGADPIAAATELAQHSQSLEAAQTVAARIMELTRP